MGLAQGSLERVREWDELQLHHLVARFLRIRFPIVYALNKADLPASRERVERVLQLLPWEPALAVSAKTEAWLCRQRREGKVIYSDGSTSAAAAPGANAELAQQVAEANRRVLGPYGGTGVLAALSAALALKQPSLVFPVADLRTGESLRPLGFVRDGTLAAEAGSGPPPASSLEAYARELRATGVEGPSPVLRDCLVLHTGATVENAYQALKRQPLAFLEGDFVRAEGLVMGSQPPPSRPLRKDEQLTWAVVRVMTNRRAHWQHRRLLVQ